MPAADLVALGSGHDDHFEHLAFAEGHITDNVLRLPGFILESVENHLIPSVKSRVDVKGDVAGLILSTEQVDKEPAESDSRSIRDVASQK